MDQLASKVNLDESRSWWPKFVYRTDDVNNSAAILNRGKLLSRHKAESENVIKVDSADKYLIAGLANELTHYARLYFRPKTPTQYRNEGIRPDSKIYNNAHMPVPVYLMFSYTILMLEGVSFTPNRLHDPTLIGSSIAELKSIKFQNVYHNKSVPRMDDTENSVIRQEILSARHAEVLVKDELPLDHLRLIVCRSNAERETLLNLLEPHVKKIWIERIRVDEGDLRLFNKNGTFMREVHLTPEKASLKFYFQGDASMRGPFTLKIEREVDGKSSAILVEDYLIKKTVDTYDFANAASSYQLRISLNDSLSYSNTFQRSSGDVIKF